MNSLWQDIRFALRGLFKDRSFTLLAIAALALGIGATTAIFSVISNVLLDPFSYTDAGRLYSIQIREKARSGDEFGRSFLSSPEFLDYKEQNHVFDRVIGVSRDDVVLTGTNEPERFDGGMVTANTFDFLGVKPLLGRTIVEDDGKPGAPPVMVLSYKVWVRKYGADPAILNKVLTLNGKATTVVGIMPSRFAWWGADMWLPTELTRNEPTDNRRFFFLLGHLKPGVREKEAVADLTVLSKRIAPLYVKEYPKEFTLGIKSLAAGVVGRFKSTLYTLLGAVFLLLLIACGNVGNLLLARATAREKEIAIRASMGASRWRLVRQFLVESFLLALGGAIVGCFVAHFGLKGLVAMIPPFTVPDEAVIHLSGPVLLFTLGVTLLTTLLFGLAPALHAVKTDLNEPLKNDSRGVSGGFRHGRLRNMLIVSEIALSLLLLTGAGLLIRSFFVLRAVELGFKPDHILVARIPLPDATYRTGEQKTRFFREVLSRLHALPGVVSATETSTLPPYGGIGSNIDISGEPHNESWNTIFQMTSDRYFETLGIHLSSGRGYTEQEVYSKRRVAVVNHKLIQKYLNGADPIGKKIHIPTLESGPDPIKDAWFEVIGVVSDVKNQGIQEEPMPEMFIPYTVSGFAGRGILVRTAIEPAGLLQAVSREIWAVDKNIPLTNTGTIESFIRSNSYAQPQFGLILVSVFAAVGLILVSIGVYGVVSYTVSRQTREIGIRMALGARIGDVRRIVLTMGLRLVGLGVGIGLVASIALMRVLKSQIWGISANDPITFLAVALVVVMVGLAACYIPARRATKIDPMVALRYE